MKKYRIDRDVNGNFKLYRSYKSLDGKVFPTCDAWLKVAENKTHTQFHAELLDQAITIGMSALEINRVIYRRSNIATRLDFYTARGSHKKIHTLCVARKIAKGKDILAHNINGCYLGIKL